MKRKLLTGVTALLLVLTNVVTASAVSVTYTELGAPNIVSFWKSLEPRSAISDNSTQGRFINTWGYVDSEGFYRCGGERDLGIEEDYYLVAMGSRYGTEIGSKYLITLDTGRQFYAALGDQKDNKDTDSTNSWGTDCRDTVEMIVDWGSLNSTVKQMGSANCYMPLNGAIVSVQRIDFHFD